MAASIRPGFLRSINLDYSGTAFSVSGGSSYTTLTAGTYANAMSLAHSVCAILWNDSVDVALSLSDDLKIQFTPDGSSPTIVWDNTTIRDILGFTGASTALSDGVTTTATYAPQYCWFPSYNRSDQGGFSEDLTSVVSGSVSADGTFSGTGSPSITVHYTAISFPMELETNIRRSAFGSTVQKRDRCLETFLRGCLESMPTLPTSVSPKGFWYYPDVNDIITQTVLTESEPWCEATDDGVQFDYSDSPHTRVYCNVSPSDVIGAIDGEPALPVSTLRLNVGFSFHTAPVPTAGFAYTNWEGV